MFDAVLEAIELKGCEVWGPLANQDLINWDKWDQIETPHAEFCKSILSPKENTK